MLLLIFALLVSYLVVDSVLYKLKQNSRVAFCVERQRFPHKDKHLKYFS